MPVAQVDKDQATVVAAPVHPALEHDPLAGVVGAEFAAGVRPLRRQDAPGQSGKLGCRHRSFALSNRRGTADARRYTQIRAFIICVHLRASAVSFGRAQAATAAWRSSQRLGSWIS